MKTTNNYEAPVAEMIEMNMPEVLMMSGNGPSNLGGLASNGTM